MPKTTIPETVEVPSDALIEAIGYLEHLADVIGALNDRQTTPLEDSMNKAAEQLFDATGLGGRTRGRASSPQGRGSRSGGCASLPKR
jgi:hypothetical protein